MDIQSDGTTRGSVSWEDDTDKSELKAEAMQEMKAC